MTANRQISQPAVSRSEAVTTRSARAARALFAFSILAALGTSACVHDKRSDKKTVVAAEPVGVEKTKLLKVAADTDPARTSQPFCGDSDIFQKLCIKKPAELKNFRFDQVAAPYPDIAACKAYSTDSPSSHPEIRACACDKCFALQQECDAIKGCREIQKCILDSGCTDIDSCYINDGPCIEVIDKWGNTSVASTLVQFLMTCAITNQCRTPADQ